MWFLLIAITKIRRRVFLLCWVFWHSYDVYKLLSIFQIKTIVNVSFYFERTFGMIETSNHLMGSPGGQLSLTLLKLSPKCLLSSYLFHRPVKPGCNSILYSWLSLAILPTHPPVISMASPPLQTFCQLPLPWTVEQPFHPHPELPIPPGM